MIHIYTLVCVECHRGWPSESADDRCPACGRPSEVRGHYKSIDLRDGETAGFPGGLVRECSP
jgi:rRNA maturation endonuclease Nob1